MRVFFFLERAVMVLADPSPVGLAEEWGGGGWGRSMLPSFSKKAGLVSVSQSVRRAGLCLTLRKRVNQVVAILGLACTPAS